MRLGYVFNIIHGCSTDVSHGEHLLRARSRTSSMTRGGGGGDCRGLVPCFVVLRVNVGELYGVQVVSLTEVCTAVTQSNMLQSTAPCGQ